MNIKSNSINNDDSDKDDDKKENYNPNYNMALERIFWIIKMKIKKLGVITKKNLKITFNIQNQI